MPAPGRVAPRRPIATARRGPGERPAVGRVATVTIRGLMLARSDLRGMADPGSALVPPPDDPGPLDAVRAVLAAVREEAITADQVADRFPLFTPGKVLSVLSTLEVKGMIHKVAGGKYLAKN